MYLNFLTILLFASLASFSVKAQEIVMATDTNQALIGERINLLMAIKADKNTQIEWPIINDELCGLEVLDRSPKDTLFQADQRIYRQGFALTTFDTGVYKIDSVALVFHRQTLTDSIFAYPIYLAYNTIQLDSTNRYYDIKKPMDIEYSYWFEILLTIVGIALIALLLWYIIKKRKPKVEAEAKKIIIPAHITALQQLTKLQQEEAWMHLPLKQYYIQLTDILRRYLQDQININAVESTTDEIVAALQHVDLNMQLKLELQDLLQMSDLVKFAKVKPVREEGEKYMLRAINFVDKTKPQDHKQVDDNE